MKIPYWLLFLLALANCVLMAFVIYTTFHIHTEQVNFDHQEMFNVPCITITTNGIAGGNVNVPLWKAPVTPDLLNDLTIQLQSVLLPNQKGTVIICGKPFQISSPLIWPPVKQSSHSYEAP